MSDWSDWSSLRAVFFLCALLIVPGMAAWDGWAYVRLTSEGVSTTAVVIGKSQHHARRSTSYSVEYRFSDAHGRRWSGSQRIAHDVYVRLQVSQRIDVVYSRSKPDLNVAYMDVLRERVAFHSFVSLLIGLVVGSLAWWRYYAERKTREHDAETLRVHTA